MRPGSRNDAPDPATGLPVRWWRRLLLLYLMLTGGCALASELPGCASGLQQWLDGRAELLGRDVREVEELQHLADGSATEPRRVRYRFDEQGELRTIERMAGDPQLRSDDYADGRLRHRLLVAAGGVQRNFVLEYAAQGYRYSETETVGGDGQAEQLRARFYLSRQPAVAGIRADGGPPLPAIDAPDPVGPRTAAAGPAFRDACLAELIDPHDGSRSWSLQYVEYDANGLDLFSASAAYTPPPEAQADPAALFRVLDDIISRGGLPSSLAPVYTGTRVAPFRNAHCQGTSLLSVVGSSRRELLSHIGALEGDWVVLDGAGRLCLSRVGNRTAYYQYALDPQGNWIAKQEVFRDSGRGAGGQDYQPGDYFERWLRYR